MKFALPSLADLGLSRLAWTSRIPRMASDIRSLRRRATAVGVILVAALLGMSYRAYGIAVARHTEFTAQGNRQQIRPYTLDANRGSVLDRSGTSLAVNDHVERIVLNPRVIRGQGRRDETLDFLVGLVGDAQRDYIAGEIDRDKAYRRLQLELDDAQVAAIRRSDLPGVRLEPEPRRIYPRGALAAHVVGRVNGQGHGNLGVELAMNEALRGREASSPAFFASYRGRGKKLLVDGHPDKGVARGQNVVLTLDSTIQAMAEEEIDTLVAEWHPVGASIIVLDPGNGEILGLANRPTFDPNHRVGSILQTTNLATQHAYEPGSTMKAITVAAALEQGTIREHQTFDCMDGRWQYTPRDVIHDTKRSGWLDVTEILAQSSNICTTKIYETLGKESLHRWVRKFHFGERPAVQLPGATTGLLADWEKWSDIQAANISFGQGMSASPLQVAAAFGALANGGAYNSPSIVRQIVDADGVTVWEREPENERLIRTATAQTVMRMLTAVVHSRKGTGRNALIDGYTVAGKTSTAQKADKGVYLEDQYYASFVGAVPAERPRLVILVSVDNPEGGHFGNDVAAPTFSRLGGRALAYLGVPRNDGSIPVPEAIELDAAEPALVDGFIPDLDLEPDLPGTRTVPFTAGVPDFTGLTLPQALEAAELAGIELRAIGSGIAVGQDASPGALEAATTITVYFESPE